ncbi:hypothetical protein I3843_14G076000 [Carya illinoinensis]|nr:hypothetical protein I3843_14G076000 [Carya illinoinensis]
MDIERGVGSGLVEPERRNSMDWEKIILPSCLIDVTLAYVQDHSNCTTASPFLNMAILLAFAAFFVGWFINPKYKVATEAAFICGIFFTYTAFFIGVTIPVPSSLKIIGWLIYGISLIAVSLSFKMELRKRYNEARRHDTTNTGES